MFIVLKTIEAPKHVCGERDSSFDINYFVVVIEIQKKNLFLKKKP